MYDYIIAYGRLYACFVRAHICTLYFKYKNIKKWT